MRQSRRPLEPIRVGGELTCGGHVEAALEPQQVLVMNARHVEPKQRSSPFEGLAALGAAILNGGFESPCGGQLAHHGAI